ncbi:MAG TPA: terminase small subunit [Waddliaceae bacterium]
MPAPLNHPPYPGAETGGRPIKYTKEFIEAEADALEKWMQQPDSIYFKRFAFDRGYSQQRLNEFAELNEKFSETLTRAREWQECRLAEGGLMGEFNGSFCKFVMGNACGWTDRTETKLSGDAVNPLAFVLQNVDGKTKELINDDE